MFTVNMSILVANIDSAQGYPYRALYHKVQ